MSGRILHYAPPASFFAPKRVTRASGTVTLQEFDENVIVEVLRRNGWTVVPSSQVHRVAAAQSVPRYQDVPGLTGYIADSVRAACQHFAGEHIPTRFFDTPSYTIVLGSAQVITPSREEVDEWTPDDAARWVPSLERLR